MKIEKDDAVFGIIVMAAVAAFFYFILGVSGMLSAIGFIILFFIPTYFLLGNIKIEKDEKIIFSFFIGTGLFSSIVYWLGVVVSFRLSIFIVFVALVGISFLIKKYSHQNKNRR